MQKICRHDAITDISTQSWTQSNARQDPFFGPAFLSALEQQHSVGTHNGWQPCHLSFEEDGHTQALLPLYLKNHSEGEFVFDWNWASASQSAGIPYYPKLVSSIPFTPVTGPRYFAQSPEYLAALLQGVAAVAEQSQASSWHLLFPDAEASNQIQQIARTLSPEFKLLERRDCHFVWNNQGYADFDDFLQTFNSRKRKNLKKERRKVTDQGIHFEQYTGPELGSQHIEDFYQFYQQTYLVRGRTPYLSLGFFLQLQQSSASSMLLLLAKRESQTLGAALFMIGQDNLYGRWWGGDPNIDCLHFETCYYQGIEFAIAKGLSRFDPGIQGEHKLLRGFEPEQTRSLHWIRDPRLSDAIDQWLARERQHIDQYQQRAGEHLPYKKR